MEKTKRKPFAVSIGREEHKRLKIMSAVVHTSMTDLVNQYINEAWNHQIFPKSFPKGASSYGNETKEVSTK